MAQAHGDAQSREIKVSRLSQATTRQPFWSIAIFAHNEAGRIRRALESIAAAAGGTAIEVWVLANGCTDTTIDEVRACASIVPNLWLAEIAFGDKANAWNRYVHEIVTPERAAGIETFFFMDGDVWLEPDAIVLLAAALAQVPAASAAGGMPATGRDREGWRQRMVGNGNIAGNFYALRSAFIAAVRARQVRMPIGIVGEDFLLSWLVNTKLGTLTGDERTAQCVFCETAQFSFRSLSPLRLRDYRTYARRKWRYTMRPLQLEMLLNVIREQGLRAMPERIEDLYTSALPPSRLKWIGLETPLRFLAVLDIRRRHRRASGAP